MATEVDAATAGVGVYVSNLPWDLTNPELAAHMSAAGMVRYASIMTHPDGRSKGCAIVRYDSADEANAAITTLTDTEIKGRKISVREDRESAGGAPRTSFRGGRGGARGGASRGGASAAPRGGAGFAPRAPRAAAPAAGATASAAAPAAGGAGEREPSVPDAGIYVGNLSWAVDWRKLKDAFAAYGPVYAGVRYYPDGKSKGFGIVRFSSAADAARAIAELNNTELEGRPMYIKLDSGPSRRAAAGEA